MIFQVPGGLDSHDFTETVTLGLQTCDSVSPIDACKNDEQSGGGEPKSLPLAAVVAQEVLGLEVMTSWQEPATAHVLVRLGADVDTEQHGLVLASQQVAAPAAERLTLTWKLLSRFMTDAMPRPGPLLPFEHHQHHHGHSAARRQPAHHRIPGLNGQASFG